MSCQPGDRISDIRDVIVLLLASDGDTDTVLADISDGQETDQEETSKFCRCRLRVLNFYRIKSIAFRSKQIYY